MIVLKIFRPDASACEKRTAQCSAILGKDAAVLISQCFIHDGAYSDQLMYEVLLNST